ncbi:MAG: vWA domain-containing protein [Candidatus Sumerlaeota bacterium]
MLEFASPVHFWLLIVPALMAVGLLRRLRWTRNATLSYSDVRLFGGLSRMGAARWQWVLPTLRIAALVLIILALARPRFGTVQRDVIGQGVDLMYVLDISDSMRAEDFNPNRLERAKALTAQMVEKRRNDRQGLTLFAGRAFVYCPLTFDADAVREMLQHVSFTDVGSRHTAIGMGLARALKKMKGSEAKSRIIILMTDGENNAGRISPVDAIRVAKELGVKIYTIGIGSHGITVGSFPAGNGRMVRQRVRTSIDEDLLRRIAEETDGMYRRATTGAELQSILAEIDALEKSEIEMREYRSYDERMALFLWPALGLILLEILLAATRFMRVP